MWTADTIMRIIVLGSNGFIGSNLLRGTDWHGVPRQQLDLTIQKDVDAFFENQTFDAVIHCAVIGGSRMKTDSGDVCYNNLLMFENVVRHMNKIGKLIYFSSGASKRGDPPTDPYGFSKWIIDKRIQTIPNAYSLRIWGCHGPGEPSTRFSAVCKRDGHVTIQKDRYFDFINIEDVKWFVQKYVNDGSDKDCDLVYRGPKLKLSEWARLFGATFTIQEDGLGEPYISTTDPSGGDVSSGNLNNHIGL
jgi:nucleoside-diphosphate-sugar epimerase